MAGGVQYQVDPAVLRAVADDVSRAATAVRALREHPGVLAGRAADAGDDLLQAALVTLGVRWDWGWRQVGDEAERWGVLLAAVAGTYEAADTWLLRGPS